MGSRQAEPSIRRLTTPRVIFRFFTGRPLDGVRRTDAVFHLRGQTSMDPSGYAHPWSLLAGYQRLLVRLVLLYVAGWGAFLLLAGGVRRVADLLRLPIPSWATLTLGDVLATHVAWGLALGIVPGVWWGVRYWGMTLRVPALMLHRSKVRPYIWVTLEGWIPVTLEGRRTWDRRYIRPVALAAQGILGTHRHIKDSRKWVHVPSDFRKGNGSPVVIRLPQGFTGSDEGMKRRLVSAVGNRLGLRGPTAQWELEGGSPRLLITNPPAPPDHVTFADVRDRMLSLPELEILLGVAARKEILTAHLKGDSPHIAVSAGSGVGKSELIKVWVMLALAWGWDVVILDWKAVSQNWARGLPGVRYFTDIADIHDECESFSDEVDRRKAAYLRDPNMPGYRRKMVVAEEMNHTAPLLKSYWDRLRALAEPEERRTMPVKSPAFDGLQAVNFTGRQFGMFLVFVAQKLSARVTNGNADLRESFAVRCLARCSKSTFKMLADQIRPVPDVIVKQGLWYAVIGMDCVLYQAPLITDQEAREFVLAVRPTSTPNEADVDLELGEPLGARPTLPNQRIEALEGEVVTEIDARKLSEMVDALAPLGITLNVLQHATKDPNSGFPGAIGGSPNKGYRYDFRAVREWAQRRNATITAERQHKGRK